MRKILDRSGKRRGLVLVLVLWIIVVLMVVAYSLAYEMRVGMKMLAQNQKKLKALGLAQAGLAKAVTDLKNTRLLAMADSNLNNDSFDSLWAKSEDKIDVPLGDGTYSVIVIDEERKLNVNSIQINSIYAMEYLLKDVGGFKDDDAQTMSQALIDYKDPDSTPCGGQGFDESTFYTAWGIKRFGKILPEGWVFKPKNDNMLTLEELLSIPGITREILYGGSGAIRDPFADVETKSPHYSSSKKNEQLGLADYLTVNNAGVLNINTCSLTTLEAAIAAGTAGRVDPQPMATQIDKIRNDQSSLKGSNGNNNTLTSLSAAGINLAAILGSTFPPTVNSSFFTITSRGEYEGVRMTEQALVQVTLEPFALNPDDQKAIPKRDRNAMGSLKSQPNLIIDPSVHVVRFTQL